MGKEIKDMISKYKTTSEKKPSSLPQYPFQKVGTDLCEKKGKTTL